VFNDRFEYLIAICSFPCIFYQFVFLVELPVAALVELIVVMADIENHLASGTNENIQLSALLSAFITARDLVPVDTES
jgi:hypothetical protein